MGTNALKQPAVSNSSSSLKMKAARSSTTMVHIYHTEQCHFTGDHNLDATATRTSYLRQKKLWSTSLSIIWHTLVTAPLVSPNILPSNLFSNTVHKLNCSLLHIAIYLTFRKNLCMSSISYVTLNVNQNFYCQCHKNSSLISCYLKVNG